MNNSSEAKSTSAQRAIYKILGILKWVRLMSAVFCKILHFSYPDYAFVRQLGLQTNHLDLDHIALRVTEATTLVT